MSQEVVTQSWTEYAQGNPERHGELVGWKISRFVREGWGGSDPTKWGGTATLTIPLSDERTPIGGVALIDGQIGGMAFLIENDLPNYPVDGALSEPFTGKDPISCDAANPWLAGMVVDEHWRSSPEEIDSVSEDRLRVGHQLEKWIVAKAKSLADSGLWPYPRRRLWLFTEREPHAFLPGMYIRWGWHQHRSFDYKGLRRWVMYKDF